MGKKLEILLVEDNEDQILLIRKELDEKRFNVKNINDGKKALDYLLKEKPDVVLLDYHIPQVDGLELINKTAEKGHDYIVMTFDNKIETVVEFMRAGATDFMPKTPGFYELIPAVVEKVYKNRIKRKKAEEELKESQERFRQAFDYAAIGISLIDMETKIQEVNQSLCDIFGYSLQELKGKSFQDFTHPEDLSIGFETVHQLMEGDIDVARFEKRYIHKDGHTIWASLAVSLLRDSENSPLYFIAQTIDITERKKTEQTVQTITKTMVGLTGQEFFDTAVSNICGFLGTEVAVIGIIDGDYVKTLSMQINGEKIIDFNYGLKGAPCHEVTKDGFKLILKDVNKLFTADVVQDYSGYIGTVLIDKNGDSIGVLCALSFDELKLPTGAKEFLEIIAAKASSEIERKKAEEKLCLSDDILRTIGTLVLVTNSKSEVVYCSPSIKKLTGYDPKEVMDYGWWKLTFDNKKHSEKVKGLLTSISDGKNANQGKHYERKVRCKDGSEKWFYWHNSKGPEDLVIGVGHDITLQKESEKKIATLNRIKIISKIGEEKIKALSMIKGMERERARISKELHDGLGQVLTAIKHEYSRFRRSLEDQGMNHSKDYNIKELINDSITAVRKISNDLMPSVLNDFGLKAALRKMTSQFLNNQVKVEFICHGEIDRLPSDVELGLFRIAQEGVSNAINHSKAKQIKLLLKKQDNIVSLLVHDDGIGFNVEKQLSYFSGINGNGITNMRERVRLINGKFKLISKPGKGTKIEVQI